jgi:hypothetical protein
VSPTREETIEDRLLQENAKETDCAFTVAYRELVSLYFGEKESSR